MKKIFMFIAAGALSTAVFAGGLLTNTNQNVRFLRNPARNASTEIDAVFSNPAGLSFMENNGFTLSLNNQSAFQTRTITSTFAPFAMNGGSETKEYKGTTTAWFIPSVQAAYKKDRWVFSGSFAIVGGGGSLKFDQGLPSFEAPIAQLPLLLSSQGLLTNKYSLEMNLKGTSITYGAQLGISYKISNMFSAFVGGRASFVGNGYQGYIRNIEANIGGGNMLNVSQYFTEAAKKARGAADSFQPLIDQGAGGLTLDQLVAMGKIPQAMVDELAKGLGQSSAVVGGMTVTALQGTFNGLAIASDGVAVKTADKNLDTKQSGWGIAPILGIDFKYDKLLIGIKYDFKTNIILKNKTTIDDTGMFPDGAENNYDIPALLSVGVSYKFLQDKLTASVSSNMFFDKDAQMTNDRQNYLNGNSYELMAGLEYKFNKRFLISAGGQLSRTGFTDKAQSDMNFNLNNISVGFGGQYNITDRLALNLAYLITTYDKYTNNNPSYSSASMPAKEVYNRTNSAFGIGLDYRF